MCIKTKNLIKIIDSLLWWLIVLVYYQIVAPPSDPPPTISFFSLVTMTEPPWANAC